MSKKKEEKVVMTDVQIKVDTEKRTKAANERIGKICEELEVQLVPVLDGWPMNIHPTVKIVSTKKYEQAQDKSA